MEKNKINVTSDNIFPIIKRFLYSDQEVFLRELVSNATDAIIKFKTLVKLGEIEEAVNELLKIKVRIDKKEKTIHIIDNGIGMTKEEVEKYINQIAFSGAEEFIQKYQDKGSTIIGHFGLGFYSSFMVAKKVMIFTQSYRKKYSSVFWSCEGTPTFSIEEIEEKRERGTEIVLFINEESKEFLEYDRILKLLHKYCKFMPIPISIYSEEEKKEIIINNTSPIWKKNPIHLKDKDYLNFYHELYPEQLEDALFWVHLKIDHPFRLTGVLYFTKIENRMYVHKDKVFLYQNQVYITGNLEGVVPDFLSLLRGVIDSPDIPLNVSRSHLQSDISVRNISKYITRKVADKLDSMFLKNRKNFQNKWKDIKTFVEYGMITTKSFFEKANNFFLYPTVNGYFFTFKEVKKQIKNIQINKEGKIVFLYTSDPEKQYSYIKEAKDRSYEVFILDSPLTVHFVQKLETTHKDISFVRVDSDHIDKLIDKKEEQYFSELSDKEKKDLKNIVHSHLMNEYEFSVKLENLSKKDPPFLIIIPEFVRRMREMSSLGTEIKDKKNFYQLIVNTNHLLMKKILKEPDNEIKKSLIQEALNLTLLSKNLLNGKNLTIFIEKKIEDLVKQ
ncbi:heat shock protein 90 [Blattabacterium sp. (Mastotermes darwiniensis) str. MADAR]|uniref:molecular chaperone HtpG n=1 Tax=Blattabacterium sp. (Mastotermes darwiniensis) TaxID=39768 RepID=UPI000231DDFE|nr:molecular chaperone HtpG [Blattabacterium sp. (Mastotermes darwiniensis)]AER40562.1 heat shock protein 90 [Blattabacterium sp. (Mastotermes darwiniensis) str. MADAR]